MKHIIYTLIFTIIGFNVSGQSLIDTSPTSYGYIISSETNYDDLNKDISFLNNRIEIIWEELGMYHILHLSTKEKRILENHPNIQVYTNEKALLRTVPNDPKYSEQWHLKQVQAEDMWQYTTGDVTASGDSIVIALIDNGFQIDHEDLKANLWINHGEIAGNNIDDDQNGYIDDIHGFDFLANSNVLPVSAHGTKTFGVIAAKGNNGLGVSGTTWASKIIPLAPASFESDIVAALKYIHDLRKLYNESNGEEGAFIVAVSNSWGFPNKTPNDKPNLCQAIQALYEVGVLVVVAGPNSNIDIGIQGDLPSTCENDGLISVMGANSDGSWDNNSGFSNTYTHISAPVRNILSTTINNGYSSDQGTSLATPIVAGGVGLLYGAMCDSLSGLAKEKPAELAEIVKQAIISGAKKDISYQDKSISEGYLQVLDSYYQMNESCGKKIYDKPTISKIYPNPSEQGNISMNIELPIGFDYVINVYNMLGQKMKTIDIDGIQAEQTINLNLSHFNAGTYIVELNGQPGRHVRQIIVL